ncbi:MAG: peptidoglycan-binding protein [Clostridia bacterium]
MKKVFAIVLVLILSLALAQVALSEPVAEPATELAEKDKRIAELEAQLAQLAEKLDALTATPEPTPDPEPEIIPEPEPYEALKKGSKGEAVKKLQSRLIVLKYLTGTADGGYGEKTAQAVTDFQKADGMAPTGIADSSTQERLFGESAKENPDPPFDPSAFKKLNYKAVARDPDAYSYELVFFSGKVIQVLEGDEGEASEYRIATKGSYDDIIYVIYTRPEGASRILEDDRVTVYGMCLGVISYESTMGGTITIPAAMASRIELK